MLLHDVELAGAGRMDVTVGDGLIAAIEPAGTGPGDPEIDARGGALLAGLHDHHSHLLATAAALTSVMCGPPAVRDAEAMARALRGARPRNGWVRGVGYHESVAGDLDAAALDRLGPDVPTRVQHRSGALWMVNSAGVRALRLADATVTGIERDGAGRPTGRLWRADDWLRERLGTVDAPDLAALSARFAARGVTGATDATAALAPGAVRTIMSSGWAQRLVSLGSEHEVRDVALGPRKIVVADHDLPSFDALTDQVRAARPRAVAVHCVTRSALVLTLAVLDAAGARPGDRIEHAAVCPPELAAWIARLGLTVVTQPALVAQRGDDYLDQVDPEDRPYLWPFASLLEAGVRVGCGSDAPYGDIDPWAAIAAAADRRAPSGRLVGPDERVSAAEALRGYLSPPDDPGGPARTPRTGAPADLCLLDRPLAEALAAPRDVRVLLTCVAGRVIHRDAAVAAA